jgi:hypothetical protein
MLRGILIVGLLLAVIRMAAAWLSDGGGRFHGRWHPGARIALHAHADSSECEVKAMRRAISRWNRALRQANADVRLELVGYAPQAGLVRDGMNTITLVRSNWGASRRSLGRTKGWKRRGWLLEGDIALNLAHHRFKCDLRQHRRPYFSEEEILIHELGHLLGLGHHGKGLMHPSRFSPRIDRYTVQRVGLLYSRPPVP